MDLCFKFITETIMGELICLFGKWYNMEVFKYKTWCTNNTLR